MKYLLTGEETERLKFRLVKLDDFDTWLALFDTDNISTFLGLDSSLSKRELCQKWFDKVFYRYKNDLGGMNALIDKETNELVGQCGLLIQNILSEQRMEIGYSILPKYWNKGYAIEAAKECKNFAFEHNFTGSLISNIHVDNIASEKVALKNKMTLKFKIDNYHGNKVNIFGIDKVDWE